MKKRNIMAIVTVLLTLCPILIGLLLWNKLPDRIPTHWGINGRIDGWSSKKATIFAMPFIMACGQIIMLAAVYADPRKKNIHKKTMTVGLWISPVLSLVLNSAVYAIALGMKISMTIIIVFVLAFLWIILGNYMPKLQQNYTIGIKIAWTLNSEENWNRTHRMAGKVFVAAGIVMLLEGTLLLSGIIGENVSYYLMIAVILISVIVPTGYSYLLFRKGI